MISIKEGKDLLDISVYAELTLSDYKEFEAAVGRHLGTAARLRLLIDLSRMTGFTVDVAWEEIKFARSHAHDFRRIAVVTSDQSSPWLSWITGAFTDAEVVLFEDRAQATAWLKGQRPD